MSGVNKVIIIGNLGHDPEIRYTQSGTAVGNLRVAVIERIKRDAEWVDHTEWVSVVVWGKLAETAGKHLTKGRQVYVEGRLTTKKYTGKDGVEKYATEVVASTVQFLGGKSGGEERAREQAQDFGYRNPKAAPAPAPEPVGGGFTEDELPFMRYEPPTW